MVDKRNHYILKGQVVRLGEEVEVGEGFFKSQSQTIAGRYRLQKINLKDIDVIIKGIATREYFYWENDSYLDNIKLNFYKTPPVILEELNGSYYSVDGHHRITIARELNLTNILSFVIKVNKLTHLR